MIENALSKRNLTFRTKITVKILISLGIVALAVILPQIAHIALGNGAGMKWLPMYLPVILGACLLGARFGVAIGISAPLVSFMITSAFGNPMPALTRLPFMMVELAVFAVIAGLFANKIANNALMAFPAVWLAQIGGRALFLVSAAMFGSSAGLDASVVFSQIKAGVPGLVFQALLAPAIVIVLRYLIASDSDENA